MIGNNGKKTLFSQENVTFLEEIFENRKTITNCEALSIAKDMGVEEYQIR